MTPCPQVPHESNVEPNDTLTVPLLARADNSHEDYNDHHDDDDQEGIPTARGLFLFRFLYFLNGLSASTWGRFGVVFYNQVGHLSPQQIGLLQGFTPLVAFIAMPCWGMLADWIQSRKHVYLICKALGTICLLALSVLPHTFESIFICVVGISIFSASGVLDASVLDYLGDSHRGLYGSVRLWTAISWGIGAVIMGWITDAFGFRLNFILYGSMMIVMLICVALGLPARSKSEEARYQQIQQQRQDTTNHQDDGHPCFQVLVRSFCRAPVALWLLQVVVIGCGMALVDSFLFLYLQNDLGASTKLCGFTVGVTVLMELPIFHYAEYLLHSVGHDALFCIAMTAYVVRVFGYTLLTPSTVFWILPLELFHGITFACMWIASIDFSASIVPREWSTTAQTILSATFSCFGNVIGAILGGWVMQRYGAVVLYRAMGCIVGAVLVLHLVVWLSCQHGHGMFLHSIQEERNANHHNDENAQECLLSHVEESQDVHEPHLNPVHDTEVGGAGFADKDAVL
jgi:MFS transporter, PPP family, 3-phenylpropionic acid transporter